MAQVITTAYLQEHESQDYILVHQSGIFGSGNSFVKTSCLAAVSLHGFRVCMVRIPILVCSCATKALMLSIFRI
jgi:hypothetical protein